MSQFSINLRHNSHNLTKFISFDVNNCYFTFAYRIFYPQIKLKHRTLHFWYLCLYFLSTSSHTHNFCDFLFFILNRFILYSIPLLREKVLPWQHKLLLGWMGIYVACILWKPLCRIPHKVLWSGTTHLEIWRRRLRTRRCSRQDRMPASFVRSKMRCP